MRFEFRILPSSQVDEVAPLLRVLRSSSQQRPRHLFCFAFQRFYSLRPQQTLSDLQFYQLRTHIDIIRPVRPCANTFQPHSRVMADTEGQDVLSPAAQVAQSSLAHQTPTNTTQDSTAVMSLPPSSPETKSPDVARDSLLSPTSASHPLPARPDSAASSTTSKSNQTQPPVPVPAPRTRGGFEVDDDEEENDETADGQDELDVYEPADAFDVDAATPAHVQTPIDRTSQSPQRENGITTAPDQPSGSPSGAPSSALPSGAVNVVVEAPTEQITPKPAQVSPSRSDVNGSLPVPKTRLAHDVVGMLEDRIKSDPRGDPDAYLDLISELKSRHKQSEVREVYDKYLKVFPHDVSSSTRI